MYVYVSFAGPMRVQGVLDVSVNMITPCAHCLQGFLILSSVIRREKVELKTMLTISMERDMTCYSCTTNKYTMSLYQYLLGARHAGFKRG